MQAYETFMIKQIVTYFRRIPGMSSRLVSVLLRLASRIFLPNLARLR